MDFKQLESFVAAVDEGSFSNAAERLQLSQSMVTIHIRNLESELGTRLLNRTTRSMELSNDGRTFYIYAKQMLKLNRDSIFALSRANHDEHALNIVATPYITRYYLASRVTTYLKSHPLASANFINCGNAEIHGNLEKTATEFAFCTMKIMNSDYAVKHYEMAKLVVITPNNSRFAAFAGGSFPNEMFGEAPLITRTSGSTLQQEFARWSKLNIPNIKLQVAAAVDDTETIKRMVRDGVGISVISEVAAKELVDAGEVLSFPLEGAMPYHLYFVYKKKYLTPEQSAFRDFILDSMPLQEKEEAE